MSVEDRVKLIIADQIGVEEGEVTPYADLTNDLGADSLDQVELIVAFEEEFGLNIPDTDAEEIRRVVDAIVYIEECLEKK